MNLVALSNPGVGINLSLRLKSLKHFAPLLCDRFFKKRYKNVEQFHDYRLPAFAKASLVVAMQTQQVKPSKFIAGELLNIEISEKYNFPLYFVSREMLNACFQTTPNDFIEWESMRLPFESVSFILPKNALRVSEEEVTYIELCRHTSSEIKNIKGLEDFELPQSQLIITTNLESGCVLYKSLTKPFILNNDDDKDLIDPYSDFLTVEQRDFNDKILATCFNLLFAMQARPELVETGRKLGRHKKSNSEIWSPNIIGRKYRVKRPEGYEPNGEHGTKRMHWRRGHFRQQQYGKGLTETKIIWLEPMLVGVRAAEAALT